MRVLACLGFVLAATTAQAETWTTTTNSESRTVTGLYDDHKSGLALVDHHDDLPHSQPSSWLSADGPRRLPPVLALKSIW
jgi:hypothetical protein